VTSFFQNEENLNTDKSTDESESLTSSEEENIDLAEVEENTRNLTLKVDSSLVTDAPQKSSKPPLPLTKPIVKSANCGDEPSPTNQSDVRPASVASKLFGRVCNREVAHAEYGYVCKVPIVNQTLEDTAETSPGKSNSNKKWDRHFIALYTDGTIGICSNQNVNSEVRVVLTGFVSLFGCFVFKDVKSPGLIIQLSLFKGKEIDEMTFGLELMGNGEGDGAEKEGVLQEQGPGSDINNLKELIEARNNSPLNRKLVQKLKMFETNFEFKFTGKSQK